MKDRMYFGQLLAHINRDNFYQHLFAYFMSPTLYCFNAGDTPFTDAKADMITVFFVLFCLCCPIYLLGLLLFFSFPFSLY
jgi:hypothetical protein